MVILRRTLMEPKTALVGVMLETSFARFNTSMAIQRRDGTVPSIWSLGSGVHGQNSRQSREAMDVDVES